MRECQKHGMVRWKWRNNGGRRVDGSRKGKYRCTKCENEHRAKHTKNLKQKALNYKGGKCQICEYDKTVASLHFHHVDSDGKDFEIAKATGWEKAKIELDKCILVCANCHGEIHDGLIPLEIQQQLLQCACG